MLPEPGEAQTNALDVDDAIRAAAFEHFRAIVFTAIALGGGVGALARYGAQRLIGTDADGFPTAIFLVNVIGAFGLGVFLALVDRVRSRTLLRPLIATGFFGAFTTFSSFAVGIVQLAKDGEWATTITYAVLTVLVGVPAGGLGLALGRRVRRPGAAAR